ncbi:MAG: MauE/DoxX family redox-associated membrane protein [Gammaproteobacteria bacterium]
MLIVIRCFLGVLFVATGVGKLLDNRAFAEIIATYQLPVPESLLLPLALGIALLEFTIGLNMLWGQRLRTSVLATLCFHIAYTALAVTTLLREIPIENCGCFGAFLARPLRWSSVAEDMAFVAVSGLGLRLLKSVEPRG